MSIGLAMFGSFLLGYLGVNAWIWHASRNYWDAEATRLFGFILIGPFVGGLTLLVFSQFFTTQRTTSCSRVVSVGGCSRSGKCGVMLADGSIQAMDIPLVGEMLCQKTTEWK